VSVQQQLREIVDELMAEAEARGVTVYSLDLQQPGAIGLSWRGNRMMVQSGGRPNALLDVIRLFPVVEP
jgi:hypothetical protein